VRLARVRVEEVVLLEISSWHTRRRKKCSDVKDAESCTPSHRNDERTGSQPNTRRRPNCSYEGVSCAMAGSQSILYFYASQTP
jgi:hypothetical protein